VIGRHRHFERRPLQFCKALTCLDRSGAPWIRSLGRQVSFWEFRMRRDDPYQERARQLAVAAGYDPKARLNADIDVARMVDEARVDVPVDLDTRAGVAPLETRFVEGAVRR
jgi:hypothetical protein